MASYDRESAGRVQDVAVGLKELEAKIPSQRLGRCRSKTIRFEAQFDWVIMLLTGAELFELAKNTRMIFLLRLLPIFACVVAPEDRLC